MLNETANLVAPDTKNPKNINLNDGSEALLVSPSLVVGMVAVVSPPSPSPPPVTSPPPLLPATLAVGSIKAVLLNLGMRKVKSFLLPLTSNLGNPSDMSTISSSIMI